jgi:transcriptional regulator with XRE-family HTH domain
MTAEELAKAVGATKAQILAYENGHRVPDPPRVQALAHALNVPPWALMDHAERDQWTLADYRRAVGLRAQDVVSMLAVSSKNYRRFETEGIVPSRRPMFVDEVAGALRLHRRTVEGALDRTPAVQMRQARAAELIVEMANRYVPKPGAWRGPTPDDPQLIELAQAYGRPVQRIRRVLTYELGELRQSHVRAERERVVAEYDTNRARQIRASHAWGNWEEVIRKELARIPQRLERFHRSAQPSDVWQTMVDLHNSDATPPSSGRASGRPDAGNWAVTSLLAQEGRSLPTPHMIETSTVDDIPVCRLSYAGLSHVREFTGLYSMLYPGVRRAGRTARAGKHRSLAAPETFTILGHAERLTLPQPVLEDARIRAQLTKGPVTLTLSSTWDVVITVQSLGAAPVGLFDLDDDRD